MKTMTCKDLGGPCEFAHRASTADEIIKAQDKHLREMVAGGDHTHTNALNEMKGRWRHPISGMGWYRATKREFAARPEDRADLGAAKTEGRAT
jgi:predicted small metal-binding protein